MQIVYKTPKKDSDQNRILTSNDTCPEYNSNILLTKPKLIDPTSLS